MNTNLWVTKKINLRVEFCSADTSDLSISRWVWRRWLLITRDGCLVCEPPSSLSSPLCTRAASSARIHSIPSNTPLPLFQIPGINQFFNQISHEIACTSNTVDFLFFVSTLFRDSTVLHQIAKICKNKNQIAKICNHEHQILK